MSRARGARHHVARSPGSARQSAHNHEAESGTGRTVLVLAWEFPEWNSRQGSALARRIGQLARGFASAGWRVVVLYRQHVDTDPARESPVDVKVPGGFLRRIAVPGPGADPAMPAWLAPVRRLQTFITALTRGDRSGRWANVALSVAASSLTAPDLIIGCFTPRGPLALAAALHRKWNVPWIADFQDPWWEGNSGLLRPAVAWWMRRTLRSAALVVQVSPEWAAEDAKTLGRPVRVFRHAIPRRRRPEPHSHSREPGTFTILYAGSLDPVTQNAEPFLDALASIHGDEHSKRVEVHVAGGEAAWKVFQAGAASRGLESTFRWLGWLSEADLEHAAAEADVLLLIPWFVERRRGVPSKLYEYIAFGTPTLIAGPDSGGVAGLLSEWGHPPLTTTTAADVRRAVSAAMRGDTSLLFDPRRCTTAPPTEEELAQWYVERATEVISEHASHVSP